ncbi:ABC transporter permease [Sphingomonas rubra]|uniref:ABC-2 type transport system permease protein n=1 Tax=Sphingomonas rubra TaxID=634430 RepID=A0A1I5U2S5_9SPHN|nr:ABC transporter permease [Sphingomonas rubra]SFP89622.1 ABC-2 type transport system permease protein [Sphingomonas rubra]
MTRVRRFLRQMLTVARRDFVATVATPVFLLFLFAPALMAGLSAVGGIGAAQMNDGDTDRARIVAILPPSQGRIMAAEDARLRRIIPRGGRPAPLAIVAPTADPAAQARTLVAASDRDVDGVLYGDLARPTILLAPLARFSGDYLEGLAHATLATERLGDPVRVRARRIETRETGRSIGGQHQAGFLAVFGVFFLTLFLAGQVVGSMAEERNNKVIEILAAAVPLEAVFGGKLLGLFGVAVLFVGFWGTVIGELLNLLPAGVSAAFGELAPAIGAPGFAFLFAAYFSMAYLLLGSAFLAIGAQAQSQREIQMLSLPITLIQVAMFALASAAARAPGSTLALVAEIFPLSSPFAMVGRATSSPSWWPHVAALAWQALWVALFIGAGARLFRRGVLQSGSGRWIRWRRHGAAPPA